ncbi:hypothetical protein Tco_0000113 [Tanacetum coccineum]
MSDSDIVMSDSEDSTVTYKTVSCPFGGSSNIGSTVVDGPLVIPEDPYAYVFVPEPVYPEFIPPEDEEEEEHPAPADSIPLPVHRVTARMSIREQPPTPFWSEAKTARLLYIPSPPSSPLPPWSSPLPQIPSPPLPISSLVPVSPPPLPASPTYPLGYKAAMI